jgi:hypothetical protein
MPSGIGPKGRVLPLLCPVLGPKLPQADTAWTANGRRGSMPGVTVSHIVTLPLC